MKIAMLGHKRIPSREGGVEIVVEELAVRMVQRGEDVTVYNRKGHHVADRTQDLCKKKKWDYKGIRIVTVPTFEQKSLNAIVSAFFATWRAVFGHYDVIHYHAEGSCAMLPLAKKLSGARCVATIHGLDWQRAKWGGFATRFLLFGEKMAAKYADQVIVLSENVQNYFRETYGRETVVIPNGVLRPKPVMAEIIREKYGLEKDSYILFLARLVPEKGLHYLIDAYEKLQTEKKLVIAGGGSHSTEYMTEMKQRCAQNKKILMTGFVQGKELEELYSNAYLYVLPSDVEGMPLSLLEAMSYGNCCLVSDIPENREVIGDCGKTFQTGLVSDLEAKLNELLADPKLVEHYKERAADYICRKYQWDGIVEKTLSVYGDQ